MQLDRKKSCYEKYIKRMLDVFLSVIFLLLFSWLYGIIALIVHIKIGRPVIFAQQRPGMIDAKTGKESIFKLYKFRSMSNDRDKEGKLLPDEERIGRFGKALRASSLDELPEIINILKGDMSFVGPRPQLVRDMVFMSDEVRMRHTARPGLTGLAQVKGRNAISWEDKFDWDLKYIDNVSFANDLRIILQTITAVLKKRGITDGENATSMDYGDTLLKEKKISLSQYECLQEKAKEILVANNR